MGAKQISAPDQSGAYDIADDEPDRIAGGGLLSGPSDRQTSE